MAVTMAMAMTTTMALLAAPRQPLAAAGVCAGQAAIAIATTGSLGDGAVVLAAQRGAAKRDIA